VSNLPICEATDIPRLLCAHCDSFTLAESEKVYLNGWEVYAPATSAPGTVKPLPEYTGGGWSEPQDVKVVDSSTICRTPGCTRPSGDAFVCAPCIDDLEMCLGDVPKLVEDLTVAAMRQVRFTSNGGGVTGNRTPLPVNLNASDRLAYLNSALVSAVKQITEQRGLPKPAIDGPERISRWLLAHVHSVAMDEGGGDIVADIKREHARSMRVIDCPPESVYVGICDGCQTPMHAPQGELEYRCQTCGAEYVVADQKAKIDERIRSAILSLREIAELSARHLGRKITIKQLEGLVRHRDLKHAGTRRWDGRHETIRLYRVEEILAIMDRRPA
jgi:LSD1 subclass zinc finger protein